MTRPEKTTTPASRGVLIQTAKTQAKYSRRAILKRRRAKGRKRLSA